MPRSTPLIISAVVSASLPGWSETLGMRWNCTSLQLSEYEQPSLYFWPMMCAWSRVFW